MKSYPTDKSPIDLNTLIDVTLQAIAEGYHGHGGALKRVKDLHPETWRKLLSLERRINKAALGGDEAGLTGALAAYKTFFQDMVSAYGEVEALPLLRGYRASTEEG